MKVSEVMKTLSKYNMDTEVGIINEKTNLFDGELLATFVEVDKDGSFTVPYPMAIGEKTDYILLEVF